MTEIDYYLRAREYLLSFESVTSHMIQTHVNEWERRQPKSINTLFKAFLTHAQNRQGMPNSIGDINNLTSILFQFDHIKVNNKYENWGNLFDEILDDEYNPPGRMVKKNKRNYWVIYCKAVISIADFLKDFQSIQEFQKFVDGFLINEKSKLALPLLLAEEIFGFGFALACDFLKESVSPEFVKPDTHINYLSKELGITNSSKNYQIFKDLEAYCNRIDKLPYNVDKIFWLVGSGNFYLSNVNVNTSKQSFIASFKG